MRKNKESKEHWLDYAEDKYDTTLINDMKAVLAIFLLFIPLPVFWSLLVQQVPNPKFRKILGRYPQNIALRKCKLRPITNAFLLQGSRWIFQATRMDGHIMGLEVLPDQVQALSPAMVMVFIPMFNKIVYPTLKRSNILVITGCYVLFSL